MIAYALKLYRDGWDNLTIVRNIAIRFNVSRADARTVLEAAIIKSLL